MGGSKPKRRRKATLFPLREILGRYGWSQYKLARTIGTSDQYVSDLARGKRCPSYRMLLRILTAIGADLGDLAPKGEAA